MPDTPYGLAYPAPTDAPDIPGDMQALAESIEAALVDGGAWSTDTTGFSASSNWTVDSVRHRVVANRVDLYVQMTRSSTAATVNASTGNMGNVDVCTVPSALRPAQTAYGVSGQQGRGAWYSLDSSGVLSLNAANGTNNVQSESLSASFSYWTD